MGSSLRESLPSTLPNVSEGHDASPGLALASRSRDRGEPTPQAADPPQAVRTADAVGRHDGTSAGSREWALHQALRMRATPLIWKQHLGDLFPFWGRLVLVYIRFKLLHTARK
jgi:hypothetical protein